MVTKVQAVHDAPQEPVTAAPGADDLSGLLAEAQGLEAENAAPAPGEPGAAVVAAADNLEAELLSSLQMARVVFEQFAKTKNWFPSYREVWSDDALRNIATAGAEVMRRHGWNMGELMSRWGPYIALAGAIAPPAMVTYQVIQDRKEELKADARKMSGGLTDGSQSAAPA